MRSVYLDNYSASPLLPEAFEAMRPFFAESFGNPASLHKQGLLARDALDKAREQTAAFVNAPFGDDIIFTSDGTEAANLAIQGAAYANERRGHHLIVTETEHSSVLGSIEFLLKQGFTCSKIKVNAEGLVNAEDVRAAITDKTILIAVHHANHEIGAIQPIQAISAIASEKGIPLYVDAEATAGWLPIDVQALGVSLLSFSPHRFYGPKGVGVLYRNRRARLAGILHGGAQENGRRAGVENIPAIVGAGVSVEIAQRDLPARAAHVAQLQSRLWNGLKQSIRFIRLNGPEPGLNRTPANINVCVEFVEGEGVTLRCDMQGVAMASGSSCGSKSLKRSHVLAAIGVESSLAQGNIMLTLGKDNTEADMDSAIATIAAVTTRQRDMSPTWDAYIKGAIDSVIEPGRR